MTKHRIHMIVMAQCLEKPISFRTDVILKDRDYAKAYEEAEMIVISQLGETEFISRSMEITEV